MVHYIFIDPETAQFLEKCYIHDMRGLNTSDHFPISAILLLPAFHSKEEGDKKFLINWKKAVSTGALQSYEELVQSAVAQCIG